MSQIRIRYADIMRSTADILRARFNKDVYDVIEDFPRACFMTKLHVAETEMIMSNHIQDKMTLTIYYFPGNKNNPTAENLVMQEDLKELIFVDLDGLLPVKDTISLEIMDYASAIVDDVLQLKIDMTMNHKVISAKYSEAKLMEELQIKYENGKDYLERMIE